VGTLIGSGRTAQAKTLSGPVPEVDRLNVTIVDDIMVRRGAPTQKLDGLIIERAQPNEAPDRPPRATLVGEWGLSMHAESHRGDEERHVLVDFGYNPVTLLNNMDILKIAPEKLDALVLDGSYTLASAERASSDNSATLPKLLAVGGPVKRRSERAAAGCARPGHWFGKRCNHTLQSDRV